MWGIELPPTPPMPSWLPAGSPIAAPPKSYPKDRIVNFVFVGWLEREKGVQELVEAVTKLQSLAQHFRLHLVGNGSLVDALSEAIALHRLVNVHVLGWLSHDKVINFLEFAHLFVLPSYTEGLPNALLDATDQGLPVFSTRVGGILDSILHDVNGMLVDIRDIDSLAYSMLRYIEDFELIPSHSEQALARVLQLHYFDRNFASLIDLLNKYSY